jgi:aspartyl/asparaginyl beta-hydroxylase (cupin superfamily)
MGSLFLALTCCSGDLDRGRITTRDAQRQAGTNVGSWHGLYLYNQGVANEAVCTACPATVAALATLAAPNLAAMTDCALGYAFFSVLAPGSKIAPHCGASNLRLRCHLPLIVPRTSSVDIGARAGGAECPSARMRVGEEWRGWTEGRCVLFDDSFEHEVIFDAIAPNDESNRAITCKQPRVVLVFDLWHPQVQQHERQLITKMFPIDKP